ncbi:Erythroid differentiation-related factor 1 isoform X2 [Oopsacas minuta]|uniref:Erythroid differentiation-related factor 1 isoform X2 n=1 Tax=Oopsacas minuta TaxID=111878 RepID=A0AAV7KAQ5_9METZ|nr:Erythroid differentiation-related factor 1 isoform X2 [Oopsacas minuta]
MAECNSKVFPQQELTLDPSATNKSGMKPPEPRPLSNVDQAIKYSHIFPQLDIIASSRHIKTLFKIPFSQEPFSLAVHRIGKTLIFDDFFLNLNSQKNKNPKNENLEKDLTISRVLSLPELTSDIVPVSKQGVSLELELNQAIVPVTQMRNKPRQRRYSLGDDDIRGPSKPPGLVLSSTPQPLSLTTIGGMNVSYGPSLRDIFWRFEDYSMLLGCDLPIFGMGTHPAVSLYIQDATMPINVLTGIDLWLDNLMNNVPEVLMAYRVENIIRYCEVVDLDTIPTLPNSNFSPDLISNICSNILHFLKANCTKEGHTYWLLRDSDEDIIKLYDLTSLVNTKNEREMPQQFENPFVDPVALLFYKVATQMCRKLSPNSDTYPEELGTVKHMLEQVIRLLKGSERGSKLELYAYEVLTEIFLGAEFIDEILQPELELEQSKSVKNPKKRSKKRDPKQDSQKSNYLVPITDSMPISWPIENLTEDEYGTIPRVTPPPIKLGSNEERARVSLDYITTSLELTRKFQNETEFMKKYICEMMRKAAVCFYILSQSNFTLDMLGKVVKYAKYCLRTISCIGDSKNAKSISLLRFKILQLLGDALCLIGKSQNISTHQEDFLEKDPELKPILSFSSNQIIFDSFIPPVHISSNPSDNILNSIDCYLFIETRSKNSSRIISKPLSKRLGNSYNEIGLLSMDSILNQKELSSDTKLELAKSAFTYFQNAIHYFNQSDDALNLVLVYSNSARLMRICAYQSTGKNIFTPQVNEYYNEAISAYQSGIKLLGNVDNPELCNNLKHELSNVKLQLIELMFSQELKPNITNEISHLLVQTISILEEIFPAKNDTIFSLSLAYHYFGKIEFEKLKDSIRNKDEKSKTFFTLSEKYFLKSNHILEPLDTNNCQLLIQKSKNFLQLYDLIIFHTYSSKLHIKQKQISNALKYITELIAIFLTNIPGIFPSNDTLLELCDYGAQTMIKLFSLTKVMNKQFGTKSNISKEIIKLEEYLDKFSGFKILENIINYDTFVLSQILSVCLELNILIS